MSAGDDIDLSDRWRQSGAGARNVAQIEWTPERETELLELAVTMTAAQIAHKWGVTRNTISGKLDRLARRTGNRPRAKAPPAPKAPPPPKPAADPGGVWLRKSKASMPLPVPTEPAEPVPATAVSIQGLAANSCRWPLFEGREAMADKLYCGDTVAADHLPYCRHHCAIAYRGLPVRAS